MRKNSKFNSKFNFIFNLDEKFIVKLRDYYSVMDQKNLFLIVFTTVAANVTKCKTTETSK